MLFKVDPDPGKDIEVDPDLGRGSKWIRIRPNVVDPVDPDPDPDPKPCILPKETSRIVQAHKIFYF